MKGGPWLLTPNLFQNISKKLKGDHLEALKKTFRKVSQCRKNRNGEKKSHPVCATVTKENMKGEVPFASTYMRSPGIRLVE